MKDVADDLAFIVRNAIAHIKELERKVQEMERVAEPVAWMHTDPDKPRVRFLEWRKDEPGYCGQWIKTPLFIAPLGCPNCASLQAQNTELDRKLAELDTALRAQL